MAPVFLEIDSDSLKKELSPLDPIVLMPPSVERITKLYLQDVPLNYVGTWLKI